MAGQDRASDYTGSYGRLPRRGVPTPDRNPIPNPFGDWYNRYQQSVEDARRNIEAQRAANQPPPAPAPNVPGPYGMGDLLKGSNQPARTGSVVDRYGDALGDMGRTAGGLWNKAVSGVRKMLPEEAAPGTSPWAALGKYLPSSGGGSNTKSSGSTVPFAGTNPVSAVTDLYKNYMSPGGKGTFGSSGSEPEEEEDIVIDEDDNSVVIGPPSNDPRNARNAAKLAAARAAGVPATEYAPEIPGGTKIQSKTGTAPSRTTPTRNAGPTRNQGPILAPLGQGSNQPRLVPPMEAAPFQEEPEFTPEYMEPAPFQPDPRYPELPDNDIEPSTAALDRYLAHLEEMPEQRQPRWWDRVAAGLIGAGEGARSGAGAGFQAGQAFLNAPYNQDVARWATKGKGLQEAAQLEGSSSTNYLKALDSQQRREESQNRIVNRNRSGDQRDIALRNQTQNTQIRAQRALTDEKRLTQQGFRQVVLKNGNAGYYNLSTHEVQDTGTPAQEHLRLLETIAQNDMSNDFRARGQALEAQRIKQGWINIGEAQTRYDAENPGIIQRR